MPDRPQPATYEVSRAAIRTRRMALGMTLRDCADKARISKAYLTQLELGFRKNMRPPTYTALRTALELDPEDRRLLSQPGGPDRKE